MITRHGKPVVELRPHAQRDTRSRKAMLEWLRARRLKSVGITSLELLNQMYEENDQE